MFNLDIRMSNLKYFFYIFISNLLTLSWMESKIKMSIPDCGGGGRESDYSVCPRPLLQFLQFLQFMSDRLHQVTQVTSGYVRLRQFTWEGQDVELDNNVKP